VKQKSLLTSAKLVPIFSKKSKPYVVEEEFGGQHLKKPGGIKVLK